MEWLVHSLDTFEHILNRSPAFPAWMTDGARSFIKAALHKTPRKRPTISSMLLHPWILQHAPLPQACPLRTPSFLNEVPSTHASMPCDRQDDLSEGGWASLEPYCSAGGRCYMNMALPLPSKVKTEELMLVSLVACSSCRCSSAPVLCDGL
jgi:serine/threonine protein kinase